MAEKKIKWTKQQQRAITARGSDVLVTASAGTGKTAVLSGRCVDIVGDKTNVWSMLVLTFTEMAAEQMRSRIAGQLRDAFLKNRDPHLRHQLILLQAADISTIHSFCKRLITEFFYKLGLDPTFRVIDADEAGLLKAEVLDKTIDWAWEQSNLVLVLRQLLSQRDLRTNDGFLSKVIQLSDFLDTVVSRQNWYERATVLADAANPFTTDLGRKQEKIISEKLDHILNQLQHTRKLYQNEIPDGDWAVQCEDTFIKPVTQCIELLKVGDWDKCAQQIRDFSKPRVNKPKGTSKSVADLIQKTVKNAVDSFEKLSVLAIINPDYLDMVGGSASLQTKVLVELVRKFEDFYSDAKRAINCLDFADLEHYALRLLAAEGSSDNPSPSETALALRRRYKYIFVDEYQDINPVQQAILDMLSCQGNVFVVGDVKQSIYAWRGADPEIFIDHLKPASVEPAEVKTGLRVDLNTNFRSVKGILDFVNKIFAKVMTSSFAKIDYDESAKLKPALIDESKAQAPADGKPVVEFHILDETSSMEDVQNQENIEPGRYEDLGVITARQRQAAMIARRINKIVGADTGKCEFQIYDKQQDCMRNVEYRDIVILMRSLAKKANDYVQVLRLAGVPVSCEATAGYFEATEISDCLALLKVLDNPQRDIELAAVLRSPFFKITDTDLAKIRIHSKTNEHNKNFYGSVTEYCNNGPDLKLAGWLRDIMDVIERWRTVARRGSLADLIWQIYRQTGFLSFVSALPNGQARRANLLKLHDRAIQFEGFAGSAPNLSLTRFVEFIEKLQEVGQDWAPAEPDAAAGNAVRILSVHKSKGLEFPVVFLAELDSQFNKRDIYADFLADADDTLGLQIIDRKSNTKLRSLAHQVIAENKLSTTMAEEMRILYVATTRAKDRLILSACEKQKHCRDLVCNGFLSGPDPVPVWQLRRCKSPLEWILYGLSDQKALHEAFETGLAAGADDNLFSFTFYDQAQLKQLSEFVIGLKTRKPGRPARTKISRKIIDNQLSIINESLSWRYGFPDAPTQPAKQSVTALTHHSDEFVKIDYSAALERQPKAVMVAQIEPPETVEARLIGTATHLVFSQLDLARPVTAEVIEEVKEKLVADNAISRAVADHIDTQSILTFFQSDLGRMVLDTENNVSREWPFTFALPASELAVSGNEQQGGNPKAFTVKQGGSLKAEGFGDGQSRYATCAIRDTIIVQGIIDMLVRTPRGLLVIDFKTDKITAGEVPQRADFYRTQLDLYGRAASEILKANLLTKCLYFLTPTVAFEIK